MGTLKKKNKSITLDVKVTNNVKGGSKVNKRIEFTRVSEEERKQLRIDAYSYIL